jgi:murein biosynthesis integral membrane protein MurJ
MNLLKSLAAVSSITMISRVLGFVRDTLLARIFGASMATDAFFIAFKLPNLLRRIFAEGAFSQAFVPILAEYKTQQGEEATRTFIAYVSGLLTLVLMLVTMVGMLAAPWVIWATAPGLPIPGKIRAHHGSVARDLSLYIADLPVVPGRGDPQYLEPFLGAGLRADPA